jgi:hypothetical protein
MMRNFFRLAFALILCSLFSCQKSNKDTKGILINTENIQDFSGKLSELFAVQKRVLLDTHKRKLIKQIDKIEKYEHNYYVLSRFDNKEIYVFDSTGKFLNTIGHFGEGEGGYTLPYDFLIDAPKKIVEVLTPSAIMYYDLNGNFKGLKKIEYPAVRFLKTKEIYAFVCGKEQFQLLVCDLDCKKMMSFLPYEDAHGMLPFQSFAKKGNQILYFRNFDNSIYTLNGTVLERFASVYYGKEEISETEYKAIKSPEEVFSKLADKSLTFGLFLDLEKAYLFGNAYKGKVGILIWDKSTQKTKRIDAQNVQNDLTEEKGFPMILGVAQNTLLTVKNLENVPNSKNDYELIEFALK